MGTTRLILAIQGICAVIALCCAGLFGAGGWIWGGGFALLFLVAGLIIASRLSQPLAELSIV